MRINLFTASKPHFLFQGLLALFLLFQLSAYANNTLTIDQQLAHADQIRSSDPQAFSRIIEELNSQHQQLSTTQQDLLKYLHAYNTAFAGQFDKAIKLSKEILLSNANAAVKFRTKLTLANILALAKNWPESMHYLSDVIAKLPEISDQKLYQKSVEVITLTYKLYGQYEQALLFANKMPPQKMGTRGDCFIKTQVLEAKLKLNQLTDFHPFINQSIKSCELAKESMWANFIRSYLATNYLENNAPTKALDVLLIHLPDIEATGYPRLTIEAYASIARAFWLKGKGAKAEEFALKALNHVKGLETTKPVVDAYYLLYQIKKSKSNHEAALDYHEKYTLADKAYMDETAAKHLAYQMAEHKAAEHKQQIELLGEQNKLLKVEQQLANSEAENNRLIITLLAAIIALLLFFGYRSWLNQRRLKELAEFDVLTGIFNRGHFSHVAQSALTYCQNTGQELSIIIFDLDFFKLINDKHGHACGDWALKRTVEVCRSIGRKNDIFARLGGEEFCILLPSCDLNTATILAEQCRKEIETIDTKSSGFHFKITASFGVTDAKKSGYNLEKLLANADSAAYSSKHNGRNRVTIFSPKD